MKSEDEADKASSLMVKHEGIPSTMVMDDSKEQTLEKFPCKLEDTHCQLKQIEFR